MIGRLIRNIMVKISGLEPERAQRIKMYLAIFYGFVGWNVFTLVLYSAGKAEMALTREQRMEYYKKIVGNEGTVNVYRIQGVSSVTTEEILLKEEGVASNDNETQKEGSKKVPRITEGFIWPARTLIGSKESEPHVETNSE